MLGFYAGASDFTRRLTSVRANAKFSSPDAGQSEVVTCSHAFSRGSLPIHTCSMNFNSIAYGMLVSYAICLTGPAMCTHQCRTATWVLIDCCWVKHTGALALPELPMLRAGTPTPTSTFV
jgi:hypothetical protein